MAGSTTPRITMLSKEGASDTQRETFERAERRYRWLPNTVRVMARSRSVAGLYLDADERNKAGGLSALERELIAVATAAHNRCRYCLTAHSVGLIALGATRDEAIAARQGDASTPRSAAILTFARAILQARGSVSGQQIRRAREAGLSDEVLLDIVAVIAENVLGNYVNNLADTPIDGIVQRAAARLGLVELEGAFA